MSGFLSHADTLVSYMETNAAALGLTGVALHVDRKFELRAEATAALEKATTGAYMGMNLAGWTQLNPDGENLDVTMQFECSFVTIPMVLEKKELPTFDVLIKNLLAAIQGYQPGSDDLYDDCDMWRVGNGRWIQDKTFLVYQFPATFHDSF